MKIVSRKLALQELHRLKKDFANHIRDDFEHRAKSCSTCETRGACCLDAHFVNVHITKLEAEAIVEVLRALPVNKQAEIITRVERAIDHYDLAAGGDTFEKTFACPLFEKANGCLVHERGKPLACIAHACYENKSDLPPDDLVAEQEVRVERLNELTYRTQALWLPLPLAVIQVAIGKPRKEPVTPAAVS